jgi:hypothetical protein
MGCKTSKTIHVAVYRTGMDVETFFTLRVYPGMRTTLFSLNSTLAPPHPSRVPMTTPARRV